MTEIFKKKVSTMAFTIDDFKVGQVWEREDGSRTVIRLVLPDRTPPIYTIDDEMYSETGENFEFSANLTKLLLPAPGEAPSGRQDQVNVNPPPTYPKPPAPPSPPPVQPECIKDAQRWQHVLAAMMDEDSREAEAMRVIADRHGSTGKRATKAQITDLVDRAIALLDTPQPWA